MFFNFYYNIIRYVENYNKFVLSLKTLGEIGFSNVDIFSVFV